MEERETSHRLFEIVEDKSMFLPRKGYGGYGKGNWLEMETFEDTDDGTFPQVASYVRLINDIEKNGASAFLNWRKKTEKAKLNQDWGYCTVVRESVWESKATLLFKEPITVVFAYVNNEPVTREVNKITGEFAHDWYWRKTGRQSKYANGCEIYFNCEKFELV